MAKTRAPYHAGLEYKHQGFIHRVSALMQNFEKKIYVTSQLYSLAF